MAPPLSYALIVSVCSYVLWRVIRPFVVKSPLANIPGPPKASWWKGSFSEVFNRDGWKFHRDIVEKYGGAVKLHMLFGDEQLYVTDPLALHHIVVKDQYIYEETSAFIRHNGLVFGSSLLSTLGEHHRRQRKMLNPVFSLKHMRDLIPIFYPIGHELRKILIDQVGNGTKEINIMEWVSRAALEYIGQGGLGYTFNALDPNDKNTYSEAIKLVGITNFRLMFHRQFLPWISNIGSPAFRKKVVQLVPYEATRTLVALVDIMYNTSVDILRGKRRALQEGDEAVQKQIGKGKDIMSVLLRANLEASDEDRLPESEILGQMSTFIFAGHETSSGAICRILHQLTLRPDVQSKLRDEVSSARKEYGGDLNYDKLMGLPYLDAVVRETLRVYPPVSQLSRTTRKDVVMPLFWPIKSADGKSEIKEIPLKKNTDVIISIVGANRSKKIWGDDAEEWKPERWLKPTPESVSKAHLPGVYASMMTFLGGGRACIGFKFAEMEIKMVLSLLLEKFIFSPGPEIYWAMATQASPVVKGQTGTFPQLPLKMSLVKE
ncbi:hypothetical protein M0805_003456 [Coniferiporia weirii]|nr:hypothetical protein M0805_003456 [Coniferiporia weirii]